jgi:hypothetical protein
LPRHLCSLFAFLAVGTCFAGPYVPAAPVPASESQWSWIDEFWKFSLFSLFSPPEAAVGGPADQEDLTAAEPLSACAVAAIPEIADMQALAFEASVGSPAVIDIAGLTPATERALVRFSRFVATAGGSITVTSAYRPSPYQEHLQNVWDKWMLEMRDNNDEACQSLRTDVEQEFTRHQLLETQRPVTFSDHTRGTGFDAAVTLPRRAHRRALTPDALARRAGLRRPDVIHDPVHFRFISSRV